MGIEIEATEEKSHEHFELIEHLGSGGFAHTYKARSLDRDAVDDYGTDIVAIKIPLNAKKERQLRKEVELNARLHIDLASAQSTNIVRYLGFGIFRGQIVMVMEYIPDGSLRDRLGRIGSQKPMDVDEATEIIRGILQGVDAMHKAHVFHRDLKPENILMRDQTPKISDLGISRMLESNELASTTTGTVYYMAPEILCDEGASFSADIWSLGVTLYEMVTGKLPFGGSGTPIGTMVDLIRGQNQVPAIDIRPDIPRVLSEIIDRSLAKDPSRRYQTAGEMCDALMHLDQSKQSESTLKAPPESVHKDQREGRPCNEEELRLTVLANPDSSMGYLRLGQFLNRNHRYGEAIEVYRQGIQHIPDHNLLHWNLSIALLVMKNQQQACHHLEQAILCGLAGSLKVRAESLLKRFKSSRAGVGKSTKDEVEQILEKVRRSESNTDAEAMLNDAVRKFPRDVRVRQTLGEFYNRSQRYNKAINVFEKGVDLDPKNPALLWDLALAYYGAQRHVKAINRLEQAIDAGLDSSRQRHARNLLKIMQRKNV